MNELADSSGNDLSLLAMARFLGRHKLTVAICMVVFIAGSIVLAFILTPMYRSEIVVLPADSSNGTGDLGQLGGLASLAGINIGGGGKKSDEALEYLRSRIFTAGFIQRHSLMPILFAKQWDPARNQWRHVADAPTIAEGVSMFSKKVRQIAEDKRTGVVTVSIIWSDRVAAAEWANLLIAESDKALRDRAIAEHGRSLEYLKAEAAQTSTVETGTAISRLMETELKNTMVARTRDAYAFQSTGSGGCRRSQRSRQPEQALDRHDGRELGFCRRRHRGRRSSTP